MNSETGPELSVVVPVLDEAENIVPLVDQIYAALSDGPAFEVVYVDDGSSDESFEILAELAARPNFRAVRHALRAATRSAMEGLLAAGPIE